MNDAEERGLRYDELFPPVDLEYFQSINGINGSSCTMAAPARGHGGGGYVIVEVFATNYRATLLPSDATEAYGELVVSVP